MTQELISRLGGTIKIGEVWRSVPHDGFDGHDEAIGKFILERTSDARKTHFGYSVYDFGAGAARTVAIRTSLTRGAAAQKLWLTAHGRKVRWVTSREQTLSSVVVMKNDLLLERNGVEVLVLVATDHIILARTLAVQPFEEWGARDFGRPKRDARSGMLPPKLARIMVNIGATSRQLQAVSHTLLDPFCGSGTVLTEAMHLGIPRIIGTDVSAEAVRDAKGNVEWTQRTRTRSGDVEVATNGGLRASATMQSEVNVRQCDVRKLSQCVAGRVDAIVTEPYLGPPIGQQGSRAAGQQGELIAELRTLYLAAFREFAKVLKFGGRAAFIVPEFRAGTRSYVVDITRDVEQFGFHRILPFPSALAQHPVLRGAADLPYARPDQHVGRRMLVFEKTRTIAK